MNRARSFLSRAPQYEPTLERTAEPSPRARISPRPAGATCRTAAAASSALHATRRSPHDGRSGATVPPDRRRDENALAARQFTERTVRLVLEVLDHRRSVRQLRPLLEPTVLDTVRVLSTGALPGRELGVATLGRLHIRMVDPVTADVYGSYQRGARLLALAGRVRRLPEGWRVTALQIG